MEVANPTRLEKILSWLYSWVGLKFPQGHEGNPDTETCTKLYASTMFESGNFLQRRILNRVVPQVRVDEANLENVKSKSLAGPLVYVTVNLGQLEYNVFNSTLVNHGLPLAQFNNVLRTRRWFPLSAIRENFSQRIQFLSRHGELPHPLLSGYLKNLILEGNSLLLSLDSADPTYLSQPIRNLFQTLIQTQRVSGKPVFVVPKQLIWDKRPRREKASFFEALFGETEQPGKWRKLILFFRHYKKRALVKFGDPICLTDFLPLKEDEASEKLFQKILSSLKIEKRTLTGPPLRPRSWFLERIFEDEELTKTLYEVAKEKNKPLQSVKRLSIKYAKEIAADVRYSYIELGVALIDWIIKNLFEGIFVDPEGLKTLKKTLSRGPTILVPNHRSHIDYLVLAHLCYTNDIVVPLVAAGLNMAFFPLGFYFRRCGAFFLRRTFAGNLLYKKVFQTYLKVLLQEGYLQEFFIEGGRSRMGKLRPPRLGMLSMVSQAIEEGAAPDIQFMPISITYDRVVEQKSYLEEMEGKPKPKEKTRDLFKLTKFLKGRYGKIYIHFDEPISWQQVASEWPQTNWEEKKSKLVEQLAQKICHAINRQVVVIPQSLVATALLTTPKQGRTLEKTEATFHELFHYLSWKQVKLSNSLLENKEGAFQEALHQFESSGVIKRHQGLDEEFIEIPAQKRMELDFFKNGSIHYLVSLSLWSNLLLTQKQFTFSLESLTKEYAFFQQLFQYEFRFSTRRPLMEHLDKLCCYLKERKIIEWDGTEWEILEEGRPILSEFSSWIRNFIESYLVAWKTVRLRPMLPNDEKALTKAMLTYGRHQLLLGTIQYPEALSQATFENAIQAFRSLGFFSLESSEAKKVEEELEKLLTF